MVWRGEATRHRHAHVLRRIQLAGAFACRTHCSSAAPLSMVPRRLMSTQPFLPLFFGDLLASTATWEGEERALYVLLLAYQWTAGPLPLEKKRIAKMCQYELKKFSSLWDVVGRKFVEQGGGLVNLRLEEHRTKAKEISDKRAAAGAKGGAKTQANAKQTPSNEQANASNLLGHPNQTTPNVRSLPRREG